MRILLVEPDEYYHRSFAEGLGALGEITVRPRGAGMLTALEELQPDVMIMELLLPDGHGYQVLEEIREFRQRRGMPIIIFSQIDNLEDVQQAVGHGVTGYFVKGRDTVNDIKKLILSLQ